MGFYIEIYFLVWFISFLSTFKVKRQIIFTILTFIIIVSFQALRWKTGTDWYPYYDSFEVSDKFQVKYIEFGYYIYNKIIRSFTDSYTVFLFVESITIYSCIWKFAIDFKAKNIPIVMAVFFSTSIFPVRFTLACAIFLLSYKYIQDRKFIKFLIVYLVATSMHQLIALTFPLYFVAGRYYKSKTLLIFYFLCCFIGLLTDIVFGNILQAVNLIFAYLPQFSQGKAVFYLSQENETRSLLSNIVSYINGGIFIYLFLLIRKKTKDLSGYDTLLAMYVFGLSVSRIILNTIPYLSRINLACSGGFSIMLLFGIYKFKKLRPFLVCFFALYQYFAFKSQINNYPDLFLPYYSIFSNTERIIL